jgi:hypothetical protein
MNAFKIEIMIKQTEDLLIVYRMYVNYLFRKKNK